MDKKFLIAATVLAASLPALAGTVMENTAAPSHKLAANQAQSQTPAAPAAAHDTAPAVKPSGLRNTDLTNNQAKAVSHDTDRKIAHGQIKPQRDTAHEEAPGQ